MLLLSLALAMTDATPAAQTRRREPAEVRCASVLGVGVNTDQMFCDVLTGQDARDGIIVVIPPHRGTATIFFSLFNRHTYSEAQVQEGTAFARYTALVMVATMDNELLARAAVQSEFRTVDDLVDRIGGGAGPGGLKAVAPTGYEPIMIEVPANVDALSILGARLDVIRAEGRDSFSSPGHPLAIISNVEVEYRPR